MCHRVACNGRKTPRTRRPRFLCPGRRGQCLHACACAEQRCFSVFVYTAPYCCRPRMPLARRSRDGYLGTGAVVNQSVPARRPHRRACSCTDAHLGEGRTEPRARSASRSAPTARRFRERSARRRVDEPRAHPPGECRTNDAAATCLGAAREMFDAIFVCTIATFACTTTHRQTDRQTRCYRVRSHAINTSAGFP